jgi:hypothetical protein
MDNGTLPTLATARAQWLADARFRRPSSHGPAEPSPGLAGFTIDVRHSVTTAAEASTRAPKTAD